MTGFFAALAASVLCFAAHLVIIASGMVRIDPDGSIKKLKRHAQLLLVIWICLTPVFYMAFKGTAVMFPGLSGSLAAEYLAGVFVFLALFFVYLTFYYVVDRSVSTRIMIEIDNTKDKRLKFEDLKAVYKPDTKYANELKGMAEGGFVRQDGLYYYNTPKGAAVGRLTAFYKKVFRLGKGG